MALLSQCVSSYLSGLGFPLPKQWRRELSGLKRCELLLLAAQSVHKVSRERDGLAANGQVAQAALPGTWRQQQWT
eukprot:1043614-Pelagomonas_calceolata.AAC.4